MSPTDLTSRLDDPNEASEAARPGGTARRSDAQRTRRDGAAVVLRLREEAVGFGSRLAGQYLRTKCLNLMDAEPGKPLVLDWDAVPLISSSFADGLVASCSRNWVPWLSPPESGTCA